MNHQRLIKKRPQKFKVIVLVILIIVLVGGILFSSGVVKFTKLTLNSVALPFWKTSSAVANNSFYLSALLKSRISQAEEIRRLREEIILAQLHLKEFEVVVEENRNLKTLLNREDSQDTISASVLVRPPQIPYDTFIIDIGKRHGLQGGEKVFFENIFLGSIEEVFNKSSKVKIISTPGIETNAFIERVNLPVKVIGRGGGNFEVDIPQEAEVEIGDFLVVPGSPQKLLGQIEEIEQTQTASFKKLLLRLPINLSEVRWVAVEV